MVEKISLWNAKQLDVFKISNPIAFVFVQGIIVTLAGLFSAGTFSLSTPSVIKPILGLVGIADINTLITGVLVALVALIGARTTKVIKNAQ